MLEAYCDGVNHFIQVGFFLHEHFLLKCTKKGAFSAFSIENR